MALPIRTTVEDVRELCTYFSRKPTGATINEAKTVLDSKTLDSRKISALKFWDLLEEPNGDKIKVTELGRRFTKSDQDEVEVLREIIKGVPAYSAVVERAAHRNEDSLESTEIAAHWHEHFKDDVGDSDKIINDQAVCFLRIADGAKLGTFISGRKGQSTRFAFEHAALKKYADVAGSVDSASVTDDKSEEVSPKTPDPGKSDSPDSGHKTPALGQGIFIAHGKNTRPLEQLKKILTEFNITFKVTVDEPNLGRPISGKVRDVMEACNCAILIFTADEELKDKEGKTIWRPSENVVYELGASGFLYDKRIVILKEEKVTFPSNFRDIGYISFETDKLDAKGTDLLKELIGFKIVKLST